MSHITCNVLSEAVSVCLLFQFLDCTLDYVPLQATDSLRGVSKLFYMKMIKKKKKISRLAFQSC